MNRTVGTFTPRQAGGLTLTLDSERLALSWRHCGRVSDLLSQHIAALLPSGDEGHAFQTITYVANELIENAYKFREGGQMGFSASTCGEEVLLHVTNSAPIDRAEKLAALVERMEGRDPGDLLVERIEANVASGQEDRSGLGFITLMADYEAQLGWRMRPVEEHIEITVSARFPV